jgi:hypothetical protein
MAYSDFSLREVIDTFELRLESVPDLFAGAPEVSPGPILEVVLPEFLPLALAINTEKARSEYLIAPLLAALRAHLRHQVSIFSGIDFTVDEGLGLSGYCDFILSRSPIAEFLCAPVAAIVEAKNENLKTGLGQCAAAMVGARLFNRNEGRQMEAVYGAVTSGSLWRFLRLSENALSLDEKEHHINQLPALLGALTQLAGG